MFVQQVILKWVWANNKMPTTKTYLSKIKTALSLLVLNIAFLSTNVYANENSLIIPEATKGKTCVEPIPEMRKNHMEYLLHKRDLTMHEGQRTKKHSLKECISCHVKKDKVVEYISINKEGQFCQSCHSYAAVSIDCFGCHATKPDAKLGILNSQNVKNKGITSLITRLQKTAKSTDE